MFLDPESLRQLTGRTRPSAQGRWLRDRGWKFELNQGGRPVVLTAEVERRMLSGPIKREPRLRVANL